MTTIISELKLDIHFPGNKDPFEVNGIYFQIRSGEIQAIKRMPVNNPTFRRKLKRLGWTICKCCRKNILEWDAAYFNYIVGEEVIKCCFHNLHGNE